MHVYVYFEFWIRQLNNNNKLSNRTTWQLDSYWQSSCPTDPKPPLWCWWVKLSLKVVEVFQVMLPRYQGRDFLIGWIRRVHRHQDRENGQGIHYFRKKPILLSLRSCWAALTFRQWALWRKDASSTSKTRSGSFKNEGAKITFRRGWQSFPGTLYVEDCVAPISWDIKPTFN